jgi:hypothetical protein
MAATTEVSIPQNCMEVIEDAIRIDGLALARVPLSVEIEMSRYGPQDPLGMFAFRIACYPDTSDIPICDECVNAAESCIRVRLGTARTLAKSWGFVNATYWEVNTYRDILLTLLRRMWQGIMEANVCHFFFNHSERGSMGYHRIDFELTTVFTG